MIVIISSKFTLTVKSLFILLHKLLLPIEQECQPREYKKVFTFFTENYKKCLPEAIVFSSENFWSYVVRCTTECWCCVSRPYSFFTHSIIRQLYVTFMIQENIIQFQVPINDSCQIYAFNTKVKFSQITFVMHCCF